MDQKLVYWAGTSMAHGLVERAEGAAAAGFDEVTCFAADLYTLEESGASLSSVRKELRDLGIGLAALDPYCAWYPGFDPTDRTGIAARLGFDLGLTEADVLRWTDALDIPFVNLVAPFDDPSGGPNQLDASTEEILESLARLAKQITDSGLRAHIEMVPTSKVPALASALELVQALGDPGVGLLLDTYHLGRAGTGLAALSEIPRELIFQLQLSDARLEDCTDRFLEDTATTRCFAGEGDLGVAAMVGAIAAGGPLPLCGPEVFSTRLMSMPPHQAAQLSFAATEEFLGSVVSADKI